MKTNNRIPFICSLGLLALALFPGCAGTQNAWWESGDFAHQFKYWGQDSKGTLVIAGGAVDSKGPVLPAFFHGADAAANRLGHDYTRVMIIPTASGNPAGSLQHNWGNFTRVAPGVQSGGLPLTKDDKELARDPKVLARVEGASALWFTGGDQSRIMELFSPGDPPPCETPAPNFQPAHPIYSAAWSMHYDGGIIGGSSAGAAIMSEIMITGGRSQTALVNGLGKGGVTTAEGMGLFPFGIVDQHFLARGRLGRLLVATATSWPRFRYGFGVEENSAMVVTLGETPMIEVVGASGLCVLDLGAERSHLGDTNGDGIPEGPEHFPDPWEFEINLLGDGDRWDPVRGVAIPAADRIPLVDPAPGPDSTTDPVGPWEPGAIEDAIFRLAHNPDESVVLTNETCRLQLSSGLDTEFLIKSSYSSDLLATRVQIQLTKTDHRH